MKCSNLDLYFTAISSVLGICLLISEMLPYASSSRCNSILEGMSHICCRAGCLVSNKNIRIQNDELKEENVKLRIDNKDLKHIIEDIKNNVINELRSEIRKLRTSLDVHKLEDKRRSEESNLTNVPLTPKPASPSNSVEISVA